MKLAVQLYTLRQFTQDLDGIKETLKRVKEMGYEAVQVSGIGEFTKEKVQVIKETCDQLGLTICATHTNLHELENNLDWIIEYHHLWNCPYIGVGMMPQEYMKDKDSVIQFAEKMNAIADRLAEENLILVYHNHAFEFEKFDGKLVLDILFDHFNERVQFELDTYWVHMGGADILEWIEKVEGKIDVIHFKDVGVKGWDKPHMEAVGQGNLNWDKIIAACQKASVKWVAVEQDDCQGRDPFDCLSQSYQYLTSKGLR